MQIPTHCPFFRIQNTGQKIEKDDDLLTFKSEALLICVFRAAGVGHAAVVKLLLAANNAQVDVKDRYNHRGMQRLIYVKTPNPKCRRFVCLDVQDRFEQKKKPSYLKREKI
jgi:hypothetical protein